MTGSVPLPENWSEWPTAARVEYLDSVLSGSEVMSEIADEVGLELGTDYNRAPDALRKSGKTKLLVHLKERGGEWERGR